VLKPPFRFAVLARMATDGAEWRDNARLFESLGYDTLLMPDHLSPQLAPIPALMAAADATSTLRVGAFVFANDYRNVVMFAKEIATLDVLSNGRIDVSVGAGWSEVDYDMMGLRLDPPGTRVARVAEAIDLLRRLWSEDRVTHAGAHYTVRGATVQPRTIQKPHPPILVGASRPSMLRLAGQVADIVSVTPPLAPRMRNQARFRTAAALADQIAIVRAAANGRAKPPLLNLTTDVQVTSDDRPYLDAAQRTGLSRDEIAASPFYLYGEAGSLVERLLDRREKFGLSYYVIDERVAAAFAPVIATLNGK
jgi:probable F420-dependent oxidoreductase